MAASGMTTSSAPLSAPFRIRSSTRVRFVAAVGLGGELGDGDPHELASALLAPTVVTCWDISGPLVRRTLQT